VKCLSCGLLFSQHSLGRTKKFCSKKCADSWNHEIRKSRQSIEKVKICKGCKLTFIVLRSSHLKYCSKDCLDLQKSLRYKNKTHPCKRCQKDVFFRRVYCNPCWELVNSIINAPKIRHLENTAKSRRLKRESVAPGLTIRQRKRLLAQWKLERQPCSYCFNLADTVDHIIPLVKGGTNFEENLTPACRPCNSSKAGRLISEWKVLYVGSSA